MELQYINRIKNVELVITNYLSSLGTSDMAPVFVGYDEVALRKIKKWPCKVGSAGQSVDGTFL